MQPRGALADNAIPVSSSPFPPPPPTTPAPYRLGLGALVAPSGTCLVGGYDSPILFIADMSNQRVVRCTLHSGDDLDVRDEASYSTTPRQPICVLPFHRNALLVFTKSTLVSCVAPI